MKKFLLWPLGVIVEWLNRRIGLGVMVGSKYVDGRKVYTHVGWIR